MPEPQQTKLKITGCAATYHGHHTNGHGYTIYEVRAERPSGPAVEQTLRSFEPLPVGSIVDLTVRKYDDLFLLSQTREGLVQRVDSLEQNVHDLADRLRRLEK